MSGPSEEAIEAAREASGIGANAALDAAHDPGLGLNRSVCLRDVADWVTDWVPEPARPLWREAFIERFGGKS